jgi:hypothetical protein
MATILKEGIKGTVEEVYKSEPTFLINENTRISGYLLVKE